MAFGTDGMIPLKVSEPIPRRYLFSEDDNRLNLLVNLDLFEEHHALAQVKEEACKRRATRKNNRKVVPCKFNLGDLVLRRTTRVKAADKLSPKWEGPFWIQDSIGEAAFKVEHLTDNDIPRP